MKKRKRGPVLFAILAAAILSGCSNNQTSNNNNKQNKLIVKNSDSSRTETINYQTTYHNRKYNKQAIVYLPKNYHAKEKHNVLYLLHGSTEVRNGRSTFYNDGNFKRVLDNLSDQNKLKDTIVVFPTYYPSSQQVSSDYYDDNPLNRRFAKTELMNDLVPAVEKRYQTYAENTSQTALEKSRNHRAFGGFSMGSITSWYVFQYDLPYFRYYLPMAGDSWTVTSDGGASEPRKTAQVLADEVKRYPKLKFKIMAGVGSGDGTSGSMTPQINAMWKLSEFNRTNLQYYTQPGGNHDAPTMARIVTHYADQLFN